VPGRVELRGLIRDNLSRLIPLLLAAVAAPVIAILADLPAWATSGAAAAALVSVVLVVAWLPLPRSAWRADHGRRVVLVTVPLIVAVGLVGIGFGARLARDEGKPAMLLLVDASRMMTDTVGDQAGARTKFEDATTSVRRNALDNQFEQTGLASFGGACQSEEPLRELVPIAFDHKDAIEDQLSELTPTGDRNLVAAASNALSLLEPFDQADWTRLVIVTGGLDGCGQSLSDLIDNARQKNLGLTWDLVGFGLSDQEKEEAGALEGEGVAVHLPDTSDELDQVLGGILAEAPIQLGLEAIRTFVTQDVRNALQEADDALDRDDVRTAEERLDAVDTFIESASDRFLTIDTTGANAVYQPMVELLQGLVGLQRQDLDLLRQRLAIAQDARIDELEGQDLEEWEALVADDEEVIIRYNAEADKLDEKLEDILDALFG
jgi:hypothetical protein